MTEVTTTLLKDDSDLHEVTCPSCNKTRRVAPGTYLCGDCGAWFKVELSHAAGNRQS